jgi:hypothetical protein
MKRETSQIVIISITLIGMIAHIVGIYNGIFLSTKQLDKQTQTKLVARSILNDKTEVKQLYGWNENKEKELRDEILKIPIIKIFPDTIREKYIECVLRKAKIRVPDANLNKPDSKDIFKEIGAECAKECNMDYSKYVK